jgi:hypothetical protein
VSLTPTLEAPSTIETEIKPKTVGFVSLGCPKNLVDSEVMMGLLHRGGAQLTPRAEDADILVVNTCSFIDSAKQESVDTILEMVQHKIANGGRAQRLIVAGCLVERYRDEIMKNIPEVDAVVGTGELDAILAAAGLTPPAQAANSPFAILTSAQLDRHASSVNQHSRPDSDSPQLRHEAVPSEPWTPTAQARNSNTKPTRLLYALHSPLYTLLLPAPKAMPAKPPAASRAKPGTAPPPPCPPTSIATKPRVSSPRRALPPTSRSPKAATTRAASASSRS